MSKIQTLKGQKMTGPVLLHQLLEKYGDKVNNIAVAIEFADGSIDVEWSDMDIADLALLTDYLKAQIMAIFIMDGSER